MSNVLFLGMPSHGHVNPTIGLVAELVRRGEHVTYFASEMFRSRIEGAGATYRAYSSDLDLFKARKPGERSPMIGVFSKGVETVEDILNQSEGFDYLIHSAAFPFTKPIAHVLGIPTVSSLAVFLGLDIFVNPPQEDPLLKNPEMREAYERLSQEIHAKYSVTLPAGPLGLIYNHGDLNLVYTSRFFAGDVPYFDDTYSFVGPPVAERKEDIDFPFDQIEGKRVLYISLGTVFGSHTFCLYDVFFEAFADWDGLVVMTAYRVDQTNFKPPANFIIRDYVPQNAILRHATAAITHCGMNSMNDLIAHEVPFVALPMGADQPLLAARARELGATVILDAEGVNALELRSAVNQVVEMPEYLKSIRQINESFRTAGGYPKAVDEIFALIRR